MAVAFNLQSLLSFLPAYKDDRQDETQECHGLGASSKSIAMLSRHSTQEEEEGEEEGRGSVDDVVAGGREEEEEEEKSLTVVEEEEEEEMCLR